ANKTVTGGRLDVSRAIDALVPPDTAIAAAPQDPTSDTAATFTFLRADSASAAATFECQLDGGSFAPCTSPVSLQVGAGTHTFAARAVSPHGEVDPTPATKTWTVVPLLAPSTTTQTPSPTPLPTLPKPTPSKPPAPKPKIVCKVPKLTGKTLTAATSA